MYVDDSVLPVLTPRLPPKIWTYEVQLSNFERMSRSWIVKFKQVMHETRTVAVIKEYVTLVYAAVEHVEKLHHNTIA